MENLSVIQKQIETSTKLKSIVGSMKTLSAVNIHQYEQAAHSLDNYQDTVETGLQAVLKQTGLPRQIGAKKGKQILVVFGSDQGLCGRFNEKLVEFIVEKYPQSSIKDHHLIVVSGNRMAARMEAEGLKISEKLWSPSSLAGVNLHVYNIILLIERWQKQHGIRFIDLFFNSYRPGGYGEPVTTPLLPLNNKKLQDLMRKKWPGTSLPYSAIPLNILFPSLVQQYLFVTIYRSQVQSLASEQASRLLSLQQAEKNIDEHLEDLKGLYRNVRQSVITSELLDLVAGFRSVTT